MQTPLKFKTSCCNLKIRDLGAKLWVAFPFFLFVRNYEVLKSKSLCILLNKNINFNKNEKHSKMEHPTHNFRETSIVRQLISESEITIKPVMSWSSRKKKEGIFFRMYTILHIKKYYFMHFFCLFLKLSTKAVSVSLKSIKYIQFFDKNVKN